MNFLFHATTRTLRFFLVLAAVTVGIFHHCTTAVLAHKNVDRTEDGKDDPAAIISDVNHKNAQSRSMMFAPLPICMDVDGITEIPCVNATALCPHEKKCQGTSAQKTLNINAKLDCLDPYKIAKFCVDGEMEAMQDANKNCNDIVNCQCGNGKITLESCTFAWNKDQTACTITREFKYEGTCGAIVPAVRECEKDTPCSGEATKLEISTVKLSPRDESAMYLRLCARAKYSAQVAANNQCNFKDCNCVCPKYDENRTGPTLKYSKNRPFIYYQYGCTISIAGECTRGGSNGIQ